MEDLKIEDFRLTPELLERINPVKSEERERLRERHVIPRFEALVAWMKAGVGPWPGFQTEEELQELPYRYFLDTYYWRVLRDYVILMAGRRCQRCGRQHSAYHRLEVHHNNYFHRGSEWRHMEDLEVLCRDCHEQEPR
jgi:HNH endonuclease